MFIRRYNWLRITILIKVASKNQPEPSIIHHIPIPKSDSSNIMGSYIVNVVPPSRAKMNPESQSFCISDSSISIPIFIKGLSPWFLDYERISFNGEIHSFSNISIGIETDGKQTSFTYNLMVSEPGLYRIVQIREQAESITGRVINSTTRVVSCPIVSWNYPTDSKTIDKCVGSSIDFGISATGSPPFQIQYLKMIGDKSDTVTLDVNGVDETIEMNGFDQDIIDEISSSRKRLVTVPIHIDLTISKPYLFRLLKITDRFGNVLEFNEEKRGDFFLVETHGNPTAKFQKSGNVKIKRENQAVIPIQVVGSPPFNIQLTKFTDSEIGTPVYFNEMKSNSFTINLDPGVFVLTTITDKYCSSKIDSQPLSITETIQPKVSISSTPIEKSCVGQIGTLVNMTFSGEPPFKIEYKSTRDGKSTIETISDIKKSRYSVELKPLYPGTYKYEFIKISDVNYNNIEIDFKLSQVIHPISTAFFKSLNGIVCIGDSIDLAGTVTGSGPWIVSYEIQDASSNKQKFTIETTLSDFIITLPEFKHGGVFIVGLTLVVDGNGCSWTIDSADVTIEVSNSRPIALFKHDRLSILYNGIGQMPVSLSGRFI